MNLNIANCPRCGKIFARGFRDVCANCNKDIEREYEQCVDYLRENRGATVNEVSEATGVSVRQITKFIREGRISLIDTPNLDYPCEACGQPIRHGNICDDCRKRFMNQARKIQTDLQETIESRQQREANISYEIKKKVDKDD